MTFKTTEAEKNKVKNLMLDRLDKFYGEGGLPDTANYERIRTIALSELEKEFKQVYKINNNNWYFN